MSLRGRQRQRLARISRIRGDRSPDNDKALKSTVVFVREGRRSERREGGREASLRTSLTIGAAHFAMSGSAGLHQVLVSA